MLAATPTQHYEALAKRAAANSHVIDCLIGCYDQVGFHEMKSCVNRTGGTVIMADSFNTSIFKQSFQRMFVKNPDGNPTTLERRGNHLIMFF